jgi:hypothetical protein
MPSQVSDKRVQRLRRYWDRNARNYDKQIAFWERRLFSDGRRWVCSQASGEVLEVAIGTGRNLPYYPQGIHLTGIEFSPAMLALARQRADELGLNVDLRVGDAQALDLPDARFDTVVCTLSLCAIPDDRQAVAEMWRVLRPGGRLLLLDHVAGAPGGCGRCNGSWSWSPGHCSKSTCCAARCCRSKHKDSRLSGASGPSSASSSGLPPASRPSQSRPHNSPSRLAIGVIVPVLYDRLIGVWNRCLGRWPARLRRALQEDMEWAPTRWARGRAVQ